MKSISSIIIVLLVISQAVTQDHPYKPKFSHQIATELAEESIRPSRAALLFSIIGDYNSTLMHSDIPISWGVDTINLESYKLDNALEKITQTAHQYQIIIISENHQRPQHRVFASALIAQLSQNGFKHLGIEALSNNPETGQLVDTMLNERGYPIDSPLTGSYTMEPQMANLIRSALENNYKLFAYERADRTKSKDRDEIQADNILEYIKHNPNGKVIIYCGFHHAIESNLIKYRDNHWMAHYVKQKLNIDPLTIYQDNFTEKVIDNEHRFLNQNIIKEPSVFVNEEGEIARLTDHVDIEVVHPKTYYIDGRPHWLYQSNRHKAVKVRKEDYEVNYPILVSAYAIDEIDPVPIDRIEIKSKYDLKNLILTKGEYRIEIFDGQNLHTYIEEVN